jgi:hypothetical protein
MRRKFIITIKEQRMEKLSLKAFLPMVAYELSAFFVTPALKIPQISLLSKGKKPTMTMTTRKLISIKERYHLGNF